MSRNSLGFCWLGSALLSLLLVSTAAEAQVIEPLTPPAFSRDTEERLTPERPNWINREDCLADDYLHFDMKVRSPTNDSFEVWIGTSTDCTTYSERADDSGRCWQVLEGLAQDSSFTIDVSVRDIVDKREVGDSYRANGSEASCDLQWEGEVAIYFMYVEDNGDVINHIKWTNTGVDLKGPSPPSGVEARIADEALQARWTPSNATDLLGYRVYCAPNGGSALGDGGIAADAGFTGGCFADGLVQGQLPGLDLEICGEAGSTTAQSAYVRGLTNGTEYAIAVAATDDIGNAGALSNVACGTPEPVTTFYESYRGAGGQGGGGICTVSTIGQTNGRRSASVALFLLGVLTLARTRRRR